MATTLLCSVAGVLTQTYHVHYTHACLYACALACTHVHIHTQRMGRIWNFVRIEYPWNYESNIESNTNIQWLQIRLEYWTVLRYFSGTRRHSVATGTSPGRRRRHRGHMHQSFCLLSDLTMKMTSYSRQTYHHISYVHIIHIPVKNKIKKTNSRKTWHDLRGSVITVTSVIYHRGR